MRLREAQGLLADDPSRVCSEHVRLVHIGRTPCPYRQLCGSQLARLNLADFNIRSHFRRWINNPIKSAFCLFLCLCILVISLLGFCPDIMAGKGLVPPITQLARDNILQSMLDHVSESQKKNPHVKIDILKQSVLQKVIDAPKDSNDTEFDPEVQLRGFLLTFEDTPAFKAEFNILDDVTKKQISAFKDGADWKKTMESGFLFPIPNSNFARVLTRQSNSVSVSRRIQDSLLRGLLAVARPAIRLLMRLQMDGATERLKEAQATVYVGGPKIYEDESQEKVMNVRLAL